MNRALFLAVLLIFAGPLSAQTTATDSATDTEAEEDAQPAGDDADAPRTASGNETLRPVPANPEGIEGLEDPDAAGFAEKRGNNTSLLADRQAPASYPTLTAPDDDGGALDGAATSDTLAAKSDNAEAQALFTALAGMNCRIASSEVADRLGPLGFDPETVTATLATLYIEGAASLDWQGNLSLPAALCPPDTPAPSPRDRVIAAMRENGCTADETTLRAAAGVSDLSDAQLLAILGPMRERGEIETGTLTATLSPELCQED